MLQSLKLTLLLLLSLPAFSQMSRVSLHKTSKDFIFMKADKEILRYRYALTPAPDDTDTLYQKSGYIHPLYAPDGSRLTRIQPPDHFHHYGIWGPWTHTKVKGKRIDFWNLKEGQGTVLFDKVKSIEVQDDYVELVVLQKHQILPSEVTAITEELRIKVWNTINGHHQIDYTSLISTSLQEGILLEQYRYGGGIGFRATEKWGTHNSDALTSEGKVRANADGTNARWCKVYGEGSVATKVGILFLSHKDNREHPEPMRMWPTETLEGKGNVFFEFSPIRHKEWYLETNKNYILQYRIITYTGDLSAVQADKYWQSFNP